MEVVSDVHSLSLPPQPCPPPACAAFTAAGPGSGHPRLQLRHAWIKTLPCKKRTSVTRCKMDSSTSGSQTHDGSSLHLKRYKNWLLRQDAKSNHATKTFHNLRLLWIPRFTT